MNFFGHAVVACWHRKDADYVLGSMLPDFIGMAQCKLTKVSNDGIDEGVSLHHQTDALFHRCRPFSTFCQQELDALSAEGVGRGTARAVSHVGFEMMLDAWLISTHPEVHTPYLSAVMRFPEALKSKELQVASFRQAHQDADASALSLAQRLTQWGVPKGYDDDDEVLRRLKRVLIHRPRLAIDADAEGIIANWISLVRPKVIERGPDIVEILKEL